MWLVYETHKSSSIVGKRCYAKKEASKVWVDLRHATLSRIYECQQIGEALIVSKIIPSFDRFLPAYHLALFKRYVYKLLILAYTSCVDTKGPA